MNGTLNRTIGPNTKILLMIRMYIYNTGTIWNHAKASQPPARMQCTE